MRLVILGAGGYGQTVSDIAMQSEKYEEIVFLDDNATADNIIGMCKDFTDFIDENTEFYPAFGNNVARLSFIEKLEEKGAKITTIIHNTAYISPRTRIENGSAILPMAVVNTDIVIKKGCIINCGAIVDHGCIIEKGVHISPGAVVKAENRIPALMKVEAGQVIENRTYSLNGDK